MRVGGSSWRPKIDPKRLQEMKNNVFEEDRTIRAEKKDNKSTQEEPKMVPWLPRSSQETPKSTPEKPRSPQETPKSTKKKPTIAPRRSADHLRIEDVDFSKIELPPRRELEF